MNNKKALIPSLLVTLFSFTSCSYGLKEYEVHQDNQLAYINDPDYKSINKYAVGASNTGESKTISLKFRANGDNQKIYISKNEDLSNPFMERPLYENDYKYDVYNLESGETYYWSTGTAYPDPITNKRRCVHTGSIYVENTYPRIIHAEGVKNIRDLGTANEIKQGLLYRGGEFNYYQAKMRSTVTLEGIYRLVYELKIKTEIDLRDNDSAKGSESALGASVSYVHIPMYYKGTAGENVLTFQNDTYDNKAAIKNVLDLLADESNYPVYFHCAKGKDRTGVVAFIVKALLNEDFNSIMKDYCWSNFAFEQSVNYQNVLDTYYQTFQEASGNTLQEKVTSYCVNTLGVSQSNIDAIKNILSK